MPSTAAAGCEAARCALLSQGDVISIAESTQVVGKKKFQPGADVHTENDAKPETEVKSSAAE